MLTITGGPALADVHILTESGVDITEEVSDMVIRVDRVDGNLKVQLTHIVKGINIQAVLE